MIEGPEVEAAARRAPGRVWLVGGGPGGPGLITVEGLRRLREADVVVADRLAWTARQRTTTARLDELAKVAGQAQVSPPAVIVVGDVVSLGDISPGDISPGQSAAWLG